MARNPSKRPSADPNLNQGGFLAIWAVGLISAAGLVLACSGGSPRDDGASASFEASPVQATPEVVAPAPTATQAAPEATQAIPTPVSSPAPTPTPQLNAGEAMIVGGLVRTRTEPSSQSKQAGTLEDLQRVKIVRRVAGENWLVGDQTWLSASPDWASEWFELEDGSYVFGAFVFILAEGEISPTAPAPEGEERWIDIDLSEQVARAMVGDRVVFEAPITSGQAPFETPKGSLAIEPDGRIAVEKMTASQAGYAEEVAQYDVERVLFTQYFDRIGNALHLNYWRPHSVFGNTPTSHGCAGLELHEAQYLWLFATAGTRVEIHD